MVFKIFPVQGSLYNLLIAFRATYFEQMTCDERLLAMDSSAPKTDLAVSSMEYCGCLLSERDIREGLGTGSGHGVMIPLWDRGRNILFT